MADGADEALCLERIRHPLASIHRVRDRLLDEGVDAGLGKSERRLLVELGWHRDNRDIDPRGDHGVDVWQHFEVASDVPRVAPRISDRDELDAIRLAKHSGVMASHRSDAEKSRA
jgi:hypothetical protein